MAVKSLHLGRHRGHSLIEVISATMLLGLTLVMALAVFPFSRLLQNRSNGYSVAAAQLQRKLEQVRGLDVVQFKGPALQAAKVVDTQSSAADATQTYSFTTCDKLPTLLTSGAGTMKVTGVGSDIVRVDLAITWVNLRGQPDSVTASTYVADKSVWREP